MCTPVVFTPIDFALVSSRNQGLTSAIVLELTLLYAGTWERLGDRVTKLEIGAHQTVEQVPVLLLGIVKKSRYPSLEAVMPMGESAQVVAGGGETTARNMCM